MYKLVVVIIQRVNKAIMNKIMSLHHSQEQSPVNRLQIIIKKMPNSQNKLKY